MTNPWFEDAAIRAAERGRYKPRVFNGEPLPTRGLRARYTFRMEH